MDETNPDRTTRGTAPDLYEAGEPWYITLQTLLDGPTGGRATASFIEEQVPDDEADIHDYKRELYLGGRYGEEENERRADFLKTVTALANVRHPSPKRFIFIGFSDQGEFKGITFLGGRKTDHILTTDDADVQNLLDDYCEPVPSVTKLTIEVGDKVGCVLVVDKTPRPPVLVTKSLKKNEGKGVLLHPGQVYTRQGSSNRLMDHQGFRTLIEERENVITEKMKEMTKDLAHVVGAPTEELAAFDLNVSPRGDGIPVRQVLTAEATDDINERLTLQVKNWKSGGGFISDREVLYEFYAHRDELDLDDEKAEFLFRSSLNCWQPGAEWILRYEGETNTLLNRLLDEHSGYPDVLALERVLLVLGKEDLLQTIETDDDIDYNQSKADEYRDEATKTVGPRVQEAAYGGVSFRDETYDVVDFLADKVDTEQLLDEVIDEGLQEDSGEARGALRDLECIRLGMGC